MSLGEQWRSARPKVAGLHLDSAACSRQSFAVIDATARHARHEAEVGGYVAAEAAAPVLEAGRAAVAALTGLPADHVVFTTGANHALDLLLSSWPGERRTNRTRSSSSGEWVTRTCLSSPLRRPTSYGVRPVRATTSGRARTASRSPGS